jgi:hypothetical protein
MDTTNPNWFLKARLKTRQLLLLIALDDYRNIHRAAEELHMTQPAASKQVKDLEEMLDVRLFDRLPRGMEPTMRAWRSPAWRWPTTTSSRSRPGWQGRSRWA